MRSMGHILIQTLEVLRGEEVVLSKFFRLQTNPSSGKTYTHTMTRKGRDVQLMFTRKPNVSKWEAYEQEKDKFMNELYDKLQKEQIKKEGLNKEPRHPVNAEGLTEKEEEVNRLYFKDEKGFTEIGKIMGVSSQRVRQIVKNIENKSKSLRNPVNVTYKQDIEPFNLTSNVPTLVGGREDDGDD